MHYQFDILDSTNKYALDNSKTLKHLDIVSAKKQTDGRGRLGRNWVDDNSILMSLIIKDDLKYDIACLSLVAAASVFEVLQKYVDGLSIKWPNDIMAFDKKICGILLQSRFDEFEKKVVVIGIGLNTNNNYFDELLIDKATSLYLLNNKFYDNEKIINEISIHFEKYYNDFICGNKMYINICKQNNYLLNKRVSFLYENKKVNGVVKDINNKCEIVIDVQEKVYNLNYGEITLEDVYKNINNF